ncbi:unnamed protein product, partial [Laminaria digitata]
SDIVSQTVLRCRVPPGPGIDGTGHVDIRVQVLPRPGGLRRSSSSSSSNMAFDSTPRGRGRPQPQGVVGVDVFEYRSPANSPSNSAPVLSRGGTPRTPGKRLTWQEMPEDLSHHGGGGGARKREWGEVNVTAPLETVYSSPMASGWAAAQHRARRGIPRSSTPRGRETPSWGGGGGGGGCNARNGRAGLVGPNGARKGHAAGGGWRRASADLGQSAMIAAAQTSEDSLGYPLLPCDGRECKIRIVERLGKISGARTSVAASETSLDDGGGGTWAHCGGGGGGGGCGGGGPSGIVQQQVLSGREGCASNGYMSGFGVGDLDDMELNELGDTELEGLLEQMWMQVMGQLTDLESELNALDARGYSVLHYTCLHSLGALVAVLLERGADVNLRTGDGQ